MPAIQMQTLWSSGIRTSNLTDRGKMLHRDNNEFKYADNSLRGKQLSRLSVLKHIQRRYEAKAHS